MNGRSLLCTLPALTATLALSACVGLQREPEVETPPQVITPEIPIIDRLQASLLESGFTTEQTERGVVVYLPSLFFEFESADLKLEAEERIRLLGQIINQAYVSDRRIAVEGHTDRIEIAWFGESAPRAENRNSDGSDNPEGRSANRRVELIILDPSD